jgi:hypothetical protein
MSLLSLKKGEKVAERPDEGVIRCFCRREMLNGVTVEGYSDASLTIVIFFT